VILELLLAAAAPDEPVFAAVGAEVLFGPGEDFLRRTGRDVRVGG
jgi:hypothetical protein